MKEETEELLNALFLLKYKNIKCIDKIIEILYNTLKLNSIKLLLFCFDRSIFF